MTTVSPDKDEVERFPGLRRVVHELRLSMRVFRDYGYQHQDKAESATEQNERAVREHKAKRNFDLAAACEAALDDFDGAGGIAEIEKRLAAMSPVDRLREARTLLRQVLYAIGTARSEPLYIVRDAVRNWIEDDAALSSPEPVGEVGDD